MGKSSSRAKSANLKAYLTPEEQAERREGRRGKTARSRRRVPAQMDHASGKTKQARKGEKRVARARQRQMAKLGNGKPQNHGSR